MNGIIPDSAFMGLETGMKRLKCGYFAFHMDRPMAYEFMANYHFDQNEICEVNEIVLRDNKKLAIAIAKNSTFRELTATNLIWMRESGVFDKHQKYWKSHKPDCTTRNEIYRSVMFRDVCSIIFILIFFQILSIVLLVFEKKLHSYKQKSQREKN